MNFGRRLFNKRERSALFMVAGGKCESCGTDLVASWHADHTKPWSRGGKTVVENGQALCADCNQKKGVTIMMTFDKLRAWQRRFVGVFAAWLEATFLLVALPGGGKTIAALFVAVRWKRAPSEEVKKKFIVVVVPSVNLKRQWQKAAKKNFGLELQTEEFTGVPKSGMDGVVTTYAGLVKGSLLYNLLCARNEIFVVLDEVHHVGANAAWGAAVTEAFKDAVKRLAMSGTPWRSDGGNIPFLTPDPETGGYEVQERFDWPEALAGKPPAIRDLAF
jgi:superfamily II DNA or RNA helicase